jgi:hypothetical protein
MYISTGALLIQFYWLLHISVYEIRHQELCKAAQSRKLDIRAFVLMDQSVGLYKSYRINFCFHNITERERESNTPQEFCKSERLLDVRFFSD